MNMKKNDAGYGLVDIIVVMACMGLMLLFFVKVAWPHMAAKQWNRAVSNIEAEYSSIEAKGYEKEGGKAVWVKGKGTEKCVKAEYSLVEDDEKPHASHLTVEHKKCDGTVVSQRSRILGTGALNESYKKHYPSLRMK